MAVSPRRLEATYTEALKLIETLPADEQLKRGTVEGETQLFEVMDAYAEQAIADEALAERARERAKRLEARAERSRKVIEHIVTGLGLTEPVQRPLYSASLTYTRNPMVTDADRLPPGYYRASVNMLKLGHDLRNGVEIPGAELGNAEPHLRLTVR